jgi:hypothetical protein
MSLKAAMGKRGREERGMLMAGKRGSGSRPEERGSRPRGKQRHACGEETERGTNERSNRSFPRSVG